MSLQTSLDSFFKKSKPNVAPVISNMVNKNKLKRRSLSLTRTPRPNKSPKTLSQQSSQTSVSNEDDKTGIICLSSDEDVLTPPHRYKEDSQSTSISQSSKQLINANNSTNSSNSSTDSSSTILLSPSAYQKSPRTPIKSSKSPGSSNKFFSPTKKRIIHKRSPAKKNLFPLLKDNNVTAENKIFNSYRKDDKTLFLLSLIEDFLRNDALKHLLEEDSQILLSNCINVVEPGLRVVCRLFWRQPGWYRTEQLEQIASDKDKLSSPVMCEMLKSLLDQQLLISSQCEGVGSMQFDDYVKLLKREELLKICQEFKVKAQSKQDAVTGLKKFSERQSIISMYGFGPVAQKDNNKNRLLRRLQSSLGACYKLSDKVRDTLDKLYVLMYLGMHYSVIREKKLELLLIHDKIDKEIYPIDKNMVLDNASVVFQNKDEFYRYYKAHTLYEQYIAAIDNKQNNVVCDLVMEAHKLYKDIEEHHMLRYKSLPPWLRRFTPANIYVKAMEGGVQELKKAKSKTQYSVAIDILDSLIAQITFRQHKRACWYEEKALILHKHLDSAEQAAKTVLEAFKTDLSEEAKDSLRRRAKMIANQGNISLEEVLRQALRECVERDHILECNIPADHVYKPPMDNYNQRGKLKFSAYTEEGRTTVNAEEYCILHYRQNGEFPRGEHCEGRIVITIFFLLFWDIIYTKPIGISGIFMNRYQRYPLDMYSEHFYINRKTLIEDRLAFIAEITDDILVDMLKGKWEERPECEVSDIYRNVSCEDLAEITQCLGSRAVSAICRRLACNFGYTHSGFPDLTLWNMQTKQIKFVEVKTDTDKPSMKQLQWMENLISHKIPAGFCYVGVNTTRSKARARALNNISS